MIQDKSNPRNHIYKVWTQNEINAFKLEPALDPAKLELKPYTRTRLVEIQVLFCSCVPSAIVHNVLALLVDGS